MKRFDTSDKKLAHIIPGNLITFKKGLPKQLAIKSVDIKNGEGRITLVGFFTTIKFESITELFNAIDWEWMEENSVFKDYSNL